mgnify:CR=1 FL=1
MALLKAAGAINAPIKALYLQPNLGYHIIQQIQDAASAVGNIPLGQTRTFVNKATQYAKEFNDTIKDALNPDDIDAGRVAGTMNYVSDAIDGANTELNRLHKEFREENSRHLK